MEGHTMSQICGLEIQLNCEEHWLLFQDWVSSLGTYLLSSQPSSFKGPKALFWPQRYTMYYIYNGYKMVLTMSAQNVQSLWLPRAE